MTTQDQHHKAGGGRCPVVHAPVDVGAVQTVQAGGGVLPLHPMPAKLTAWRWVYVVLGLACFALGAIGAVVPVLPTTVFLLSGSFLLTRSCPWLENKLLAIPLLAPYAAFVRSTEPMTTRARVVALSCMWCSIAVSLTLLGVAGKLSKHGSIASSVVLWSVLAAGVVGTIVIVRFRRR